MRLPEVHIWRDRYGSPTRIEFHDGPERMELRHVTRLRLEHPAKDVSTVEFTLIAKPIYHDADEIPFGDPDE